MNPKLGRSTRLMCALGLFLGGSVVVGGDVANADIVPSPPAGSTSLVALADFAGAAPPAGWTNVGWLFSSVAQNGITPLTGEFAWRNDTSGGAPRLTTTPFTSVANPILQFDVHSFLRAGYESSGGPAKSSLVVDVLDSANVVLDTVFQIGDTDRDGDDGWLPQLVDLSAYVGQEIKVRFRVTDGPGTEHDIAIDNVRIDDWTVPVGQIDGRIALTSYIPISDSTNALFNNELYNRNDCGRNVGPAETVIREISIVIGETALVDGAFQSALLLYDHAEDGISRNRVIDEVTDELWGDADPSNGFPPGFPGDELFPGDTIVLRSTADPGLTNTTQNKINSFLTSTENTTINYSGGDRITGATPFVMSEVVWSDSSATLLGGAIEILDVSKWGRSYTFPVGEDINDTRFQVVAASILAGRDGTVVTLPDASTVTLNQGESYYLADIDIGDEVSATSNIGVTMLTGDQCATFESRWYSLYPTSAWDTEYYTPVYDGATTSDDAELTFFNPGTSPLTVTVEDKAGSTTVTVPAGRDADYPLNRRESVVRVSASSEFFAVLSYDTTGSRQIRDWGYSLPPSTLLSPVVQAGLALGVDPTQAAANPTLINSPIYVGAIWDDPGAAPASVQVCVDWNGDGGINPIGTSGLSYDYIFTTSDLNATSLDEDEVTATPAAGRPLALNDLTGSKLFVCNPANPSDPNLPAWRLTAAWGQDGSAPSSSPSLDAGTAILNLPFSEMMKDSVVVDVNQNGVTDLGDRVDYTLTVRNQSGVPIPRNSLKVWDNLPPEVVYVPGTTTVTQGATTTPIPDDGPTALTVFPLDDLDTTNEDFDDGGVVGVDDIDDGSWYQRQLLGLQEVTYSFQTTIAVSAHDRTIVNTGLSFDGIIVSVDREPTEIVELITIGNRVWFDEDGDGRQDAGEDGVANATVELSYTDFIAGPVTVTTTTNIDGGYAFTDVPILPTGGTYTVRVTPAPGLDATFDLDAGFDNTTVLVSDPLGASPTDPLAIQPGEEFENADFGVNWVPPTNTANGTGVGAIGDRVWSDANGNGVPDLGEPGLAGVEVTLFADTDGDGEYDEVVATTTTGPDGGFVFDDVPAGAYAVEVTTPPAGTQTGDPDEFGTAATDPDNRTTTPIVLGPGDVFVNADFGYQPDPATVGSIGDTIFVDLDGDGTEDIGEPGVAGVTVSLLDAGGRVVASTTTDQSGAYRFDGVAPGDYTVVVTDTDDVLDSYPQTADPDGTNDNSAAVTVTAAAVVDSADFGYVPATTDAPGSAIGDVVFLDRNGNGSPDPGEGLEGVEVIVRDVSGGPIASVLTDENGNWFVGGLLSGEYQVEIDVGTLPPGVVNSIDPDGASSNVANFALDGTTNNLDLDFGYTVADPNTIGGTIWVDEDADGVLDAAEAMRLEAITVVLTDADGSIVATTSTDAAGNYSFSGLPDGDYLVNVIDAANVLGGKWHSDAPAPGTDGQSQDDHGYVVSVAGGESDTTGDFGYYDAGGSVGDLVFVDADGNGVRDPAEPGMVGATVQLDIAYPDGTVVTMLAITSDGTTDVDGDGTVDPAGSYHFGNLLLDEDHDGVGGSEPMHTISVITLPPAFATYISSHPQGTTDATGLGNGTDDDADDPSGELGFPGMGGVDDPTNDFGFVVPATIQGTVTSDLDADGTGDIPLPGVVVQLWSDTDGDGAPDTLITDTTTDGTGDYEFTGLLPDDYVVVQVNQPGYIDIADVDTTDPGDDIADLGVDSSIPVTLIAGETDDGNGFVDELPASVEIVKTAGPDAAGQVPDGAVYTAVGTIGEIVTYEFEVSNDGVATLSNVTVADPLPGLSAITCDAGPNGSVTLLPGASTTCTATYTLAQADIDAGEVLNTATATAERPGGDPNDPADDVNGTDNASVDVPQTTGMGIVKSTNGTDHPAAPGAQVAAGSAVTWTYEITNPGNVALATVVLVDDNGTPADAADDMSPFFQTGDADDDGLLDPGETWLFQAAGAAASGQYTNVADVTGDPVRQDGSEIVDLTDPTASDDDFYFGASDAVDIEKSTNGADADVATGPVIEVGDPVTWSYVVTNSGNAPFDGVTVTDDQGVAVTPVQTGGFNAGDTDQDDILDPGESWEYTASGVAAAGQYTNVGSIGVTRSDGLEGFPAGAASDADPSNYYGGDPSLVVEKATNGSDADAVADSLLLPAGDPVTWTYVVTNDGNLPLSAPTVTDDQGVTVTPVDANADTFNDGDLDVDGVLDVGEVWSFEATGSAATGQYTNIGSAVATPLDPTTNDPAPNVDTSTDDDASNHFGVVTAVDVQKTVYTGHDGGAGCPGGELVTVPASTDVTYCFVVTNPASSNVSLAPVMLEDTDLGITDADVAVVGGGSLASLAPGASVTVYFEATTSGDLVNTAAVTATPEDPNAPGTPIPSDDVEPPAADDTAEVDEVAPSVEVTKTAGADAANQVSDGATYDAPFGSDVVYVISVENTGDTVLADVVVDDDACTGTVTLVADGDGDVLLDVGEIWTYDCTTTAIAADVTNTADATANPVADDGTDLVDVPDVGNDDTAEVEVPPAITVDKSDPTVTLIGPGARYEVSYAVTVTNDGGAGTYELTDAFDFANGITIVAGTEVAATSTPGVTVNEPGFDGVADATVVAAGQAIESQAIHVFTITAEADVDPAIWVDGTPASATCTPDDGGGSTDGFFNSATVTDENALADSDDGCTTPPDSNVSITKTVTAGPTVDALGDYSITYVVVVDNTGDGAALYDLTDEIAFGDGVSIATATIVAADAATPAPDAGWDGTGATTVQTGEPIDPQSSHAYSATVTGSIAAIASTTAADCSLDAGEAGTGFLNTADLTVDGQTTETDACESVPTAASVELVKTAGSDAANQVPDGDPYTGLAVDDVVTYVFTITNTGTSAVSGVNVTDPLPNLSAITCDVDAITPGESATCTATYTITQADVDAGSVLNTATVDAEPSFGDPNDPNDNVSATDDAVVEATQTSVLTLLKTADQSTYSAVAEDVTYTYSLTNSGTITLVAPFTIADDKIAVPDINCPADASGVGDNDPYLQPGESIACTGTYSITQPDLDGGEVTNLATATAQNPNGTLGDPNDDTPIESNEDDETIQSDNMPGIEIVKTAGPDAGTQTPDGDPYAGVVLDDVVTYLFTVTNIGNISVSGVGVTDPLPGLSAVVCGDPDDNGTATLLPGQRLVCEATYTITQDDVDAGVLVNTATAGGTATNGEEIDDTDDATVEPDQMPGLEFAKTVYDGHDAGASQPGGELVVNVAAAPVTYVFTLTNSGNVEVRNVDVVDPALGISTADLTLLSGDPTSVGVGETVIWYYETAIDGDLVNSATATGVKPNDDPNTPDDDVVSNPDTAEVDEVAPALDVVKSAGADAAGQVADGATYQAPYESTVTHVITVTNVGDIDLDTIEINDDLCDADPVRDDVTDAGGDDVLSVGEAWTYSCAIADVTADYSNTSDGSGNPVFDFDDDPNTPPTDVPGIDENDNPTGDDAADVDVLGAVSFEKSDPSLVFDPDSGVYTLTYTIEVTNDGATALYDLDDTLQFSPATTITGATASVIAPNDGSVTPSATWTGQGDDRIVTGVSIANDVDHVYQVVATATIESSAVTTPNSDCLLDAGESGTGFLNSATLSSEGNDSTDTGCEEFPDPGYALVKQVSSGPTNNGDGTYDLAYTITVSNTGDGPGSYDLNDEFTFGDGITVVDATVVNTIPGDVTVNEPGFDGGADQAIASAVPIGGGVTHAYVVTVTADALAVSSSTAADCTVDGGENGTGFRNEATVTDGAIEVSDDDCTAVPDPIITVDKTVVGSVVVVDGDTFTTTYEVVVSNASTAGPGSYTLDDELQFPTGATAGSATVVAADAGTPTPSGTWNGVGDVVVIAAPTPLAPGAAHTFTITVTADIAPTLTSNGRDCTLDQGETGTGFTNAATVSTFGTTDTADACAEIPDPNLSITKTITQQATVDPAGNYTGHTYEIVVTNAGEGPGTYDLTDTLRFGEGITITSAVMTDPDGAPVTGWDGITSTQVADDRPILGGAQEVYTAVVDGSVGGVASPEAADCTLDAGETGTGFLNEALLTYELGDSTDIACEEEPDPVFDITKTETGATTQADGTQIVTYDIVVRNTAGSGIYDVSDTIRFGDGITVVDPDITASPAGVTTNPAWDGAGDTSIATGVFLAGGGTHTYTVRIVANAFDATTSAGRDCTLDPGETGTGFLNQVQLDSGQVTLTDDDCVPVAEPDLAVAKVLVSGPTSNNDGTYDLVYDVTVSNGGDGPDRYELVDSFSFGDGITVVGTPTVTVATTNASNLPVATPDWNGEDAEVLATDQLLIGNTTHTYTISVTADAVTVTSLSAGDCTLDRGEDGTGFRNDAAVTPSISDAGTADDCGEVPPPLVSITKSVNAGPTSIDADTTEITYRITVTNAGDGPATYDIDDDFGFGDGITVANVVVGPTVPDPLNLNGAFDGAADTSLVVDQPIAPVSVHTIDVTLTADIAPGTVNTARDCELAPGEDGTGLLNSVTLSVFDEPLADDEACGEVPHADVSISKVANEPTVVDGDTVEITYDLTITNVGDGIGEYDLTDTLRFGDGITVDSIAAASGDVTVSATFDGSADPTVVLDQSIESGTSHLVTITVVATTAAATTSTARDCALTEGEVGSGLLNSATLAFDGVEQNDEGCRPAPEPDVTIDKRITDVPTQIDGFVYTIMWELVVTNGGDGPDVYDLADTVEFGDGVTLETIDVIPATGRTASGTFDGLTDTTVATGVELLGGAVDTWTVTATVTVAPTITDAARDCAVDAGETGTALRNTTTVTTPFGDDDSDSCAEIPDPLLEIDKTAGDLIELGENTYGLDYEIVVRNTGGGPDTYTLTDTFAFADELIVTSASVSNDVGPVTVNASFDGAGDPLVASDVGIAAGAAHVFTVSIVIDASNLTDPSAFDCDVTGTETGTGTLNRASVNPTAQDCVEIPQIADLDLTKTSSAVTVTLGDQFTWTLTVTNLGPANATGVTVTDQLPAGVEFVSSTGVYDETTGVWTIGDIPFGDSATIDIVVAATSTGDLANSAEITSSDQRDPDSTPGNADPGEDDQDDDTVAVASPPTTTVAPPGTVPTVGSDATRPALRIGLLFFAMGALALLVRRRPRTVTP